MADDLPGWVHLHAPLTVLAPGLLLLLAEPGIRLLPRGRRVASWAVLAVALGLMLLGLRTAWLLSGPWAALLGGWVYAGWPALLAAALAATTAGWRSRHEARPALLAIAAAFLQVACCLPLAFLAAAADLERPRWRLWALLASAWGLGLGLAPAWGQLAGAAGVLVLVPRWRIEAGLAALLALAALLMAMATA